MTLLLSDGVGELAAMEGLSSTPAEQEAVVERSTVATVRAVPTGRPRIVSEDTHGCCRRHLIYFPDQSTAVRVSARWPARLAALGR